jgi:PKD domain
MKKKKRIIFKASIVLVILLAFVMPEGATIMKTTLSEVTFEFSEVGKNSGAEFEWVPVDASGSHTISGNVITLHETDQLVTLEIHVSGWAPHLLKTVQATVDSAGYSNGVGGTLIPYGWPGSPEDGAFINTGHPKYVFNGFASLPAVSTATLNYIWGTVIFMGGAKTDDGQTYYFATLILDVPSDASGTYTIGFINNPSTTFMSDDSSQNILPLTLTPALITIAPSNEPPNTPSKPNGPSSGEIGEWLTYSTSTTDPDGDQIRYAFDINYDGVVDYWSTSYYPSGVSYNLNVKFGTPDTYYLRFKAEDEHGAQSGWSTPKQVIITGANDPPNTPSTPLGSSSGSVGTTYSYSTSTTDPDGDQVKYGWDWDGDGTVDEWSGFYSSGSSCSMLHSWSSFGSYQVKVKAQDEHGAESGWSSALTVIISAGNDAPNKPDTPSGQTNGKTGTSYTYSTSTEDLDGDQVWYKWDWGDEVSNWDGPYNSGDSVDTSHVWSNQGTYAVKVKAKDTSDAESVWSDPLSISMPKNKPYINTPFIDFLQNHPHLFPLLRQLLGLQ